MSYFVNGIYFHDLQISADSKHHVAKRYSLVSNWEGGFLCSAAQGSEKGRAVKVRCDVLYVLNFKSTRTTEYSRFLRERNHCRTGGKRRTHRAEHGMC